MKQFKIFVNGFTGVTEAVKQGWSWPGCLFGIFWALAKKLWWLVAALIGFTIVNVMFINSLSGSALINWHITTNLIGFIICGVIGWKGNEWREANLFARGFKPVETVTAANAAGALAMFHQQNQSTVNTVTSPT